MAKTSGDAYFKFALDMVASNLSKQVESRADYKWVNLFFLASPPEQ
jgi:hypothetical protein